MLFTYRLSQLNFPMSQSKDALRRCWEGDYPDPVKTRGDVATVYKEFGHCYIMVKETDKFSVEDWINNFNGGKKDVMSIRQHYRRDERCGCEKKRFWWCKTHRQCNVHIKIGRAYDGFGSVWNEMRSGIYSHIQKKCDGASKFIFTGKLPRT